MRPASFTFARALGALILVLGASIGCSDSIHDPNKCRSVTCENNAYCAQDTGLCTCLEGFEEQAGLCVESGCHHDADCSDGLVCNGEERCDVDAGRCIPGIAVACGDNAFCEEPDATCSCNPGHSDYGQGCEPTQCEADADCDDGLTCNGIETCDLERLTCTLGVPVTCRTGTMCTEDDSAAGYTCVDATRHCMLMSTTDWGTVGMLAIMDLETGELRDNITSYHQDAVIRIVDGEVYVLNRHLGDSVVKLDHNDGYRKLWDFSVAHATLGVPNPHDMVRWGDYLYIALYNDGRILRANARPNPLDIHSFLGRTIYEKRIVPPSWDGHFSELTALRIDQGILFGLTQGLGNSWKCDTPANRGRIYAWTLPDLEDAPVFADGKNYVDLAHCNPGGWVDMPDGRLLIHSLGKYRFMDGDYDDGGLQIFDLAARTPGPVVATETSAGRRDIFSVIFVEGHYYAILAGADFSMLEVVEVQPPANPDDMWVFDPHPFYTGYTWSLFGFREHLYVAERSSLREVTLKFDRTTKTQVGGDIETLYSPETMTYFQRFGSCW